MNTFVNLGGVDRFTRVLFAMLFIIYGLQYGWTLGLTLGIILGLTALIGFCPLYKLFRLSTVGLPKA